jgi:cell division protein FtsW (lipid II flippase)
MSRATQALIFFVSAALLFILAGLVFYERSFVGFHDGHLSESDHSRKYLLAVFIVGAFVSSLIFSGVGLRALRRDSKWFILICSVITILFVVALFVIDAQNCARLESGIG